MTTSDVIDRALQGASQSRDPFERKLGDELQTRTARVRKGRLSHDDYLLTCGEIAGLEVALRWFRQSEEGRL